MNFDFRTKLIIILLTMSLVAVITSDILIYTLICALNVYLIIQGYKKHALTYDIVCIIFIFLRFFSNGNGLTFLMPEMFLFMVLRMMLMAMAAQPVIGMAPGEAVSVFKKIHLPTSLGLPLTFMLRFFPTVRGEFSDVFAALKMRHLISWKHPLDSLEYIVTPIIFRSSRISEELAASAESRGISNQGNHTCIRKIEFKLKDLIMCIIAIIITIVYFIIEKKVI
ncbi:energy-coupling factor transporter transmembrane component T [Clostridium sp. ZBS2]|uniref:energy-coupling factor transporter transmembrane component T n=1 Tax=Clostridium sp. ZBS2 TaxID=2949976 RepID=UPI0020798E00|nr:energy-coupling factor transporter transmembrane component T [Clostridium sp. ZBS2]